MFIKLTKSDGSPVWMNPDFMARIESWKTGSAVAVAGDGDFEVRETPAAIFAMIGASDSVKEPAAPAEEAPKRKSHARRRKVDEVPDESPSEAQDGEKQPSLSPSPSPAPETESKVPDTLFPDMPDEVSEAAAILKKNRCRSRKRMMNMLKSLNPKISTDVVRAMLDQMEARGLVSIDAQGHAVFS